MALKKGYRDLLAEAERIVECVSAADAIRMHSDAGVLLVDIRDVRELQREGRIPGGFHAPRGMIEFWVDPESPYHKEALTSGRRLVLYCASGWRSALAARTLHEMGIEDVAHLVGGFTAWKEAGGPVEALSSSRAPEKR